MVTGSYLKRRDIANQVWRAICQAAVFADCPRRWVSMPSCAGWGCGRNSRFRLIYQVRMSSCKSFSCFAGSLDVFSGSLVVCRVQAQTVVPHCRGRCSRNVLLVAALTIECRMRSFVTAVVVGVDSLLPRAAATE
jgi:hypothetical protein